MPDTVGLVDYFYIEVPDRPGEGARVVSYLKETGEPAGSPRVPKGTTHTSGLHPVGSGRLQGRGKGS